MGQKLSIDATTNIIFGVVTVIAGGATVLQTAHLARLRRRPTRKPFQCHPRRLLGYYTDLRAT
jgi:hypothetical protein